MKFGEERTIRRKTIFEGKIIDVHVDDVTLPNGGTSKREIVTHGGAVAVIALLDDDRLLFVEQYRKPIERASVEIPAGKLEKGEDPLETAKRELEEETGYRAKDWSFVQSFATSPGFASEIMHIYFARGLYEVEEPLAPDEDEFVRLYRLTIEEAERLVKEERIYDAKTAFALLYVKDFLHYNRKK